MPITRPDCGLRPITRSWPNFGWIMKLIRWIRICVYRIEQAAAWGGVERRVLPNHHYSHLLAIAFRARGTQHPLSGPDPTNHWGRSVPSQLMRKVHLAVWKMKPCLVRGKEMCPGSYPRVGQGGGMQAYQNSLSLMNMELNKHSRTKPPISKEDENRLEWQLKWNTSAPKASLLSRSQ